MTGVSVISPGCGTRCPCSRCWAWSRRVSPAGRDGFRRSSWCIASASPDAHLHQQQQQLASLIIRRALSSSTSEITTWLSARHRRTEQRGRRNEARANSNPLWTDLGPDFRNFLRWSWDKLRKMTKLTKVLGKSYEFLSPELMRNLRGSYEKLRHILGLS